MIEYIFGAAVFLVVVRLVRGPTFADRILSMDIIVNFMVLLTVYYSVMHNPAFMDIAILVTLLSFLGTLAVTKYVIR